MENHTEVIQETKHSTTIWLNNSSAGYISQESENINSKRYKYPNVHSSIIDSSQEKEAT